MTIPRYKTGDKAADQFQGRTQEALKGVEARPFPSLLAQDITIPLTPDSVTIDLPAPITAWFVANRREGGEVFEVSRTGRRLTLSASTNPADCDIGGW